jgi:hypothetical protein
MIEKELLLKQSSIDRSFREIENIHMYFFVKEISLSSPQ